MSNLPQGYIQLDYIQSTGTQAIDTGIIPTTSYNIEVVAVKDNNASLFGSGACSYVLTGNGSGTGKYPNYFYVGQTLTSPAESGQVLGTIDQAVKHTWKIINGAGYCDTIAAANPERVGTNQPTTSLYLFARNVNNAINDAGPHTIYSCKIWNESSELIRDYVPTLRISDSKPGLYDTISGEFFTNKGTGEFIYQYSLKSYKTCVPITTKTDITNYRTFTNDEDNQYNGYKTIITMGGQ